MILSLAGILVLLPVFFVISIIIKFDSPGPIFFRQCRIGRYGVPFRIHKFRTMSVNGESAGRLTIGADNRITRSGQYLRKYKLDELPQLIDVFLGKMSLVGPRPEVKEFIDCYSPDVRNKVLSVRPGITDYASIEMIDEGEILGQYDDPRQAYIDVVLPMKQSYYLRYVEEHNMLIDLQLILKTVYKIVVR
ncbi:sugar transferase [Pseudomonas sp. KSR10]|nr:sugar transferase [Pseudomonas sp. KSR10]